MSIADILILIVCGSAASACLFKITVLESPRIQRWWWRRKAAFIVTMDMDLWWKHWARDTDPYVKLLRSASHTYANYYTLPAEFIMYFSKMEHAGALLLIARLRITGKVKIKRISDKEVHIHE